MITNKLRLLIAGALIIFSLPSAVTRAADAQLTEKTFHQDMSYYTRTAKIQKLKPNDRLYILDRLRKKYASAEFDLSDLYAEIDRWTTAKLKESETKAPEPQPEPEPEPVREQTRSVLSRILVTETQNISKLTFELSGKKEYKDILKKDPRNKQNLVLVLYLYNTVSKLKPAARSFSVKNGLVRQVQVKTVSAKPPTLQVSISLRADRAYAVTQNDRQLVLSIDKKAAAPASSSAEPAPDETAAPAVLAPTFLTPEETFVSEPEPPALSTGDYASDTSSIISAGDILEISVLPAKEFSSASLVQNSGTVDLPVIGKMKVAGEIVTKVEALLETKYAEYLRAPKIKITLKRPAKNQVTLLGQVKSPGRYDLVKPWKCFELISQTGGFLNDADQKKVTLYSGNASSGGLTIFNVKEYLANADPNKDIPLKPGDIIEVPQAAVYVYVIGGVKKPGRYSYQEGLKLMQAIYIAGGFREKSPDDIRLIRTQETERLVRNIDARDLMRKLPAGDIDLQGDDVIFVPQREKSKGDSFTRGALPWVVFFSSIGLVLALLI